jgi:hypothetical protein
MITFDWNLFWAVFAAVSPVVYVAVVTVNQQLRTLRPDLPDLEDLERSASSIYLTLIDLRSLLHRQAGPQDEHRGADRELPRRGRKGGIRSCGRSRLSGSRAERSEDRPPGLSGAARCRTPQGAPSSLERDEKTEAHRRGAMRWAQGLKRVFQIEICRRCGGRAGLLAFAAGR